MTPSSPPGPMTGTDHELATLAARARSLNGAQAAPARTLSTTGFSVAAATPAGPPVLARRAAGTTRTAGLRASPSEAAHISASPASQVDAQPLAAERGAQRRQDQRQAGRRIRRDQAVGQPVQPGELAARRGVDLLARHQGHDVVGVGLVRDSTSATIRPWRSTTIRSASRNIWSMSWQASRIVVPRSRRRAISCSTWADSMTPSEAVGSSSSSSRGLRAIARATATNWRWPPGQRPYGPGRVRERDLVAPQHRRGGGVEADVGQQAPAPLPAEQQVRGDVQVVAQRQVLPDHRDPLARRPPPGRAAPACRRARSSRCVARMSPAMQRTSVVLPAPFSPPGPRARRAGPRESTPCRARSGPNRTASPDTESSGQDDSRHVPLAAASSAPSHILTVVTRWNTPPSAEAVRRCIIGSGPGPSHYRPDAPSRPPSAGPTETSAIRRARNARSAALSVRSERDPVGLEPRPRRRGRGGAAGRPWPPGRYR